MLVEAVPLRSSLRPMTTFLAILTGGGLAALGGLLSGLVTNWLGDRRDRRKYEHEQAMASETRRQQRLEKAYIELFGFLAHHAEVAWSMGPLGGLVEKLHPLPGEERRRIDVLISAYGSPEVRKLLDEWIQCFMALSGVAARLEITTGMVEDSQGSSPQLEDEAKRERKAMVSYQEALQRADEAIRDRVRRELAGEV